MLDINNFHHYCPFYCRVYEGEDKSFHFEILFDEKLCITDNTDYKDAASCVDALCDYMKKLYNHPLHVPFEVKL